jgi:hypothetical protein
MSLSELLDFAHFVHTIMAYSPHLFAFYSALTNDSISSIWPQRADWRKIFIFLYGTFGIFTTSLHFTILTTLHLTSKKIN